MFKMKTFTFGYCIPFLPNVYLLYIIFLLPMASDKIKLMKMVTQNDIYTGNKRRNELCSLRKKKKKISQAINMYSKRLLVLFEALFSSLLFFFFFFVAILVWYTMYFGIALYRLYRMKFYECESVFMCSPILWLHKIQKKKYDDDGPKGYPSVYTKHKRHRGRVFHNLLAINVSIAKKSPSE